MLLTRPFPRKHGTIGNTPAKCIDCSHWHLFLRCFAFNKDTTVRIIYRDSTPVASILSPSPLIGHGALYLGGGRSTYSAWQGDMAEAVLYTRCLDAADVALSSAPHRVAVRPVLWLRLTEGYIQQSQEEPSFRVTDKSVAYRGKDYGICQEFENGAFNSLQGWYTDPPQGAKEGSTIVHAADVGHGQVGAAYFADSRDDGGHNALHRWIWTRPGQDYTVAYWFSYSIGEYIHTFAHAWAPFIPACSTIMR